MKELACGRTGRGLKDLWQGVRHDVFRLLFGAVLVLLVMCGTGLLLTDPLTDAGFGHWEGGLDRWFADHRHAGWNTATNAASLAGDTPAAIALSVLAFVVLRLLVHRWRESVVLATSMIGEVILFSSTAAVVGRDRPTVQHLDGTPPTSSFPSGHTAAATTLYGVLVLIVFAYSARTLWRVLAVSAAALIVASIGMSRLYRGMHFPSDILGGILLGLLWITVTYFVLLRGHTRAPSAS
jgi:undecaprenyl-diphosphatase